MDKSKAKTTEIEDLLQYLGGLTGRYQVVQLFLQILSSYASAFISFAVVFIGYQPDYQCSHITNTSQLVPYFDGDLTGATFEDSYDRCSIQVDLNSSGVVTSKSLPCVAGITFSMPSDTSFRTEWELVCDKAGLTELSQTLLTAGEAVGALVASTLSDRYGRKTVYVFSDIALLVLATAMGLAPNIYVMMVVRIATGMCGQGIGMAAYTMFMELLPNRWRPFAALADAILWSLGQVTMAAIAYGMQGYSWRYLQLALATAFLYSLCLPCVLDESMLWLLNNERIQDVERIVAKACRWNGKDVDVALKILREQILSATPDEKENESGDVTTSGIAATVPDQKKDMKNGIDDEVNFKTSFTNEKTEEVGSDTELESRFFGHRYNVLDLFKHKAVLVPLFVTCVVWLANSLFYYGVLLGSSSLAGNRFLNFGILTLMEIPANITAFLLLQRINRRPFSMMCELTAGTSLILSVIFVKLGDTSTYRTLGTVVTYVGKFALSGCFNVLFIFCLEVFPTTLRTVGMGVASATSRIAGMGAPFFVLLGETVPWAPGVVFGCMCVLAGLSVLLLPETRHRALPNTIEEIREWKNTPPPVKTLSFKKTTETA